MDLDEAKDLAVRLMHEHGLTPEWGFRFNRRATAAGVCNYRARTIELSKLMTPNRAEADVTDTILHEIAHALAGSRAGHGNVWKLKAIELGARPRTCVADVAACSVPGKYRAHCADCGPLDTYRHRQPTRQYSHNRCGGRIEWEVR